MVPASALSRGRWVRAGPDESARSIRSSRMGSSVDHPARARGAGGQEARCARAAALCVRAITWSRVRRGGMCGLRRRVITCRPRWFPQAGQFMGGHTGVTHDGACARSSRSTAPPEVAPDRAQPGGIEPTSAQITATTCGPPSASPILNCDVHAASRFQGVWFTHRLTVRFTARLRARGEPDASVQGIPAHTAKQT